MTSVLFKETLRTFRRTKARFISILAIVALGISFFAGIKAAYPDMEKTAVRYFKNNNLMDICMVSTIGFTDDDVLEITDVEGVEYAAGSKFVDSAVEVDSKPLTSNGSQTVCRSYGFNVEQAVAFENGENDITYINRLTLLEGRYPQNSKECLIDNGGISTPKEFQIGKKIKLKSIEDESLDDNLNTTEFTIVGIIETPRYVSIERGQTTVGSGELNCFIYIPDTAFSTPFYSEVCVTVLNSKQYDPYSEDYFKYVKSVINKIKSISASCLNDTKIQVREYYESKLVDAKAKYNAGLAQLENIQSQIKNGQNQITAGENELNAAKIQAQKEFSAKYSELLSGESKYSDGLKQYNEKYNEYLTSKERLESANKSFEKYAPQLQNLKDRLEFTKSANEQIAPLNSQISDLQAQISALQTEKSNLENEIVKNKAKLSSYLNGEPGEGEEGSDHTVEIAELTAKINASNARISDINSQIASAQNNIDTLNQNIFQIKSDEKYYENIRTLEITIELAQRLKEEVKSAEESLVFAENELKAAKKTLDDSGLQIKGGWDAYNQAFEAANSQIDSSTQQLNDAKAQLASTTSQYSEKLEKAKEKLDESKYKLDDAQKMIEESLKKTDWYVYDRNQIPGYEGYGQTAENMKAFATVFPLFFFVVAALVCLTTMTRMVDEERTQLGTLKALGYSGSSIQIKYIFYAFLASIIGSAIGLSIGLVLFPKAIYSAYSMMYNMPDLVILYPWEYMVSGTVFACFSTMFVSYIACRKEMRSVPAQLMRPRAPKSGKRILLERMSFIWKHLNFTSKVTARNIFRNKKRFIMTLIGIAGCTALLLTGFGLSDSINAIITTQYGNDGIVHADCQIAFKNSQPADRPSDIYTTLENSQSIAETLMFYSKTVTGFSDTTTEKYSVNLVVPQSNEKLSDFVKIQDRLSKEKYQLTDKGGPDDFGVIVSEKLASKLGVSVGEEISLKISEEQTVKLKVSAITENYTYHYVYMTAQRYKAVFNEVPAYNFAYINYSDAIKNISDETQRNEIRAENAKALMKFDDITAVVDIVNTSETLSTMFKSLDYVIMVFIISAALLAFVVLYNLTNININERQREIATLKVLGFHNYESTSYIGRENFAITVLGTVLGLFGGIYLHKFVIEVAEVNVVMFGRTIDITSYVWSVILTFVFSLIVSVIMSITIKKIQMVESLKSIE